jgi:hypothetical protein
VGLEFELAKQVLYHLSQTSSSTAENFEGKSSTEETRPSKFSQKILGI